MFSKIQFWSRSCLSQSAVLQESRPAHSGYTYQSEFVFWLPESNFQSKKVSNCFLQESRPAHPGCKSQSEMLQNSKNLVSSRSLQERRPAHSGYTSQSEMSDAGTSSSRHVTAQRQGSGGSPTERRGASTVVHRVCQPSPLSSERISYNFEGICRLLGLFMLGL